MTLLVVSWTISSNTESLVMAKSYSTFSDMAASNFASISGPTKSTKTSGPDDGLRGGSSTPSKSSASKGNGIMSYSGGGDDSTPTKQRVAQQQGPAVGLGVYIAEQGSTKSSGDEKGVLQSWYDWAFGADEDDSPIITPEAEPDEVVNEVLNEKDFPLDPRTNLPVGALPRQRYFTSTDPLDLASLEGSTQGFNPSAVATGLEVVQALNPSISGPVDPTDMLPQTTPVYDPSVFALEGPEAATSEASVESNLNTNSRKEIQTLLNTAGFNAGTVDGVFGSGTRGAISEYQATIGLPTTGYLDSTTRNALKNNATGVDLGVLQMQNTPFMYNTMAGTAVRGAESMRFNPYSLNHDVLVGENNDKTHDSGLTIGIGIDLGQQSAQGLRDAGVPESIITKLENSGFLGVRPSNIVNNNDAIRTQGHAAMLQRYNEAVANGTLVTLTPRELDILTESLYTNKYEPAAERAYNSTGAGNNTAWSSLTEEARAALTTEVWHRGGNVDNIRTLSRYAANNDITGLTNNYHFKDRGPKVRASLVQSIIGLPPSQIDGLMGRQTDQAMREWLTANNVDYPQNASRETLINLVFETNKSKQE